MPLRTHTPAAMPLPASVASSSSSPTVYDNVDNQYDQVKRIFFKKNAFPIFLNLFSRQMIDNPLFKYRVPICESGLGDQNCY